MRTYTRYSGPLKASCLPCGPNGLTPEPVSTTAPFNSLYYSSLPCLLPFLSHMMTSCYFPSRMSHLRGFPREVRQSPA